MNELIEIIREFISERNWEQFHSPKNLAISISLEAAELLENFQWEDKNVDQIKKNVKNLEKIGEEIADIFIYALDLADKFGMDVEELIKRKIEVNRSKYPIEKSYGSAKKYNNLCTESLINLIV